MPAPHSVPDEILTSEALVRRARTAVREIRDTIGKTRHTIEQSIELIERLKRTRRAQFAGEHGDGSS
jgi:hypothetical protein